MSNTVIFVFGSNLAGRHGKGAALDAVREYGAVYGQGVGRQGNAYAIPTKDAELKTLDIGWIQHFVDEFLMYVREHPELTFLLTRVGCGLAGYVDSQIAPLFRPALNWPNVIFPDEWQAALQEVQ